MQINKELFVGKKEGAFSDYYTIIKVLFINSQTNKTIKGIRQW
jgi:hypothetical protein